MATVTITPDQNGVVGEIFIAAPPARVFQAITDPDQMPLWWGAQGLYRTTEWKIDLRVGGEWSSEGVGGDGKPFRVSGEYLEIDPPRLLVHSWLPSFGHPQKTLVRWELEPQSAHGLSAHGLDPGGPRKAGAGTLVRIRQTGFGDDLASATNHSEGWKRVLGWLHGFAENGATVDTR
jgi:uncharacterized protein YndB with AHSA1/START domain